MNYLRKYSTTSACDTTREIGSNTKVRRYLSSHITVFQIPLSVRYTSTTEVTKFA